MSKRSRKPSQKLIESFENAVVSYTQIAIDRGQKSRLEARKEKCEIYCFREAVAAKGISR